MKYCPQCNNTYTDDSISFCLVDGMPLSAMRSPNTEETLVSRVTDAPPTLILPPFQPPAQTNRMSPWIYAVVGAMGMAIVALVGILVVPRLFGESKENQNVTSQVAQQPTPNPPKAEVREAPNVQAKVPPVPKPTLAEKSSEPVPSSVPAELSGRWQGEWSSLVGTTFSANVNLAATGNGNGVQGTINWMMISTPQATKQAKIGLTAVEYVRGSYDPTTRMLVMAGYKKDDPNNVIILDKYRLTLGEGGILGGATWNGGKWRGRLSLSR